MLFARKNIFRKGQVMQVVNGSALTPQDKQKLANMLLDYGEASRKGNKGAFPLVTENLKREIPEFWEGLSEDERKSVKNSFKELWHKNSGRERSFLNKVAPIIFGAGFIATGGAALIMFTTPGAGLLQTVGVIFGGIAATILGFAVPAILIVLGKDRVGILSDRFSSIVYDVEQKLMEQKMRALEKPS